MPALPTADVARPSRGGRPRDPSRDGVIRAAILHLLADVGYGALTMDAVAAEAGVGKATIYRRWRTKQDLVVDTISDLNAAEAHVPNTGTLEGDLRALLHTLVGVVNGPAGAATLSLLSTVPRHPALAEAFRNGPVAVWQRSFDQVWEKAEKRGEVGPGFRRSVAAESIGALIVQRWLLTGLPVDEPFADDVLETVVMPLVRASV
jgi:AcrR family transcriptional regulator